MSTEKFVNGLRVLITVVLGGIGMAAGFKHTHDWAAHHGQIGWLAWADAVVIEGMAVVAGFEVKRDHRAGNRRPITFPLVVLVAAFVVQMAAQVSLAEPTPSGWLVAAVPALGFLVVVKLLMRRAPIATPPATSTNTRKETAGSPVPTPAEIQPPAPRPIQPPRPTTTGTLGKLPTSIRESVTTATAAAHTAGRPVTADDLSARVTLPEAMLTALVDELNASINHHPVTT